MINKLVVENLKHRPLRTLLSIVAISIQVTMVLTLVGISTGMMDEQARRAIFVNHGVVQAGIAAIALYVEDRTLQLLGVWGMIYCWLKLLLNSLCASRICSRDLNEFGLWRLPAACMALDWNRRR